MLKGKYFPGFGGVIYIYHKKISRLKSSSKVTALHYAFAFLEPNDDDTATLQELHLCMIRSSELN